MKTTQLLYLLLLTSFYSCTILPSKKLKKKTLPPITQTGANTLGFLFQKTIFLPSSSNPKGFGTNFGKKSPFVQITEHNTTNNHSSISIEAKSYNQNLASIKIYLYNLSQKGIGQYLLDEGGEIFTPNHNYIYVLAKSPSTKTWTRYYSYKNSGTISITRKDNDNNIISGVFHAKLQNQEQTETIEIESGRFDINIEKNYK